MWLIAVSSHNHEHVRCSVNNAFSSFLLFYGMQVNTYFSTFISWEDSVTWNDIVTSWNRMTFFYPSKGQHVLKHVQVNAVKQKFNVDLSRNFKLLLEGS